MKDDRDIDPREALEKILSCMKFKADEVDYVFFRLVMPKSDRRLEGCFWIYDSDVLVACSDLDSVFYNAEQCLEAISSSESFIVKVDVIPPNTNHIYMLDPKTPYMKIPNPFWKKSLYEMLVTADLLKEST